MSTTRALEALNAIEEKDIAIWIRDNATGSERLPLNDVELRVNVGRLNHGFEWGVFNQGQVVIQGQWCETLYDAKRTAREFARKWMVDDIRI